MLTTENTNWTQNVYLINSTTAQEMNEEKLQRDKMSGEKFIYFNINHLNVVYKLNMDGMRRRECTAEIH